MIPAYQTQHESDAWRQSAAVLPRPDGIYACEINRDYSLKYYEAILFTGWGTVFVFDFNVLTGLFPVPPFGEAARLAMQWFGHPSPQYERRGLYGVNGHAISFTAQDMRGDPAQYTGGIDANARELRLDVVPIGHTGRRPVKRKYKYHSLAPRELPRLS